MYIWVKQFDHSKILHKTCWAHLSTRQGFSTWTCGWAQRLVSTKLRYQMIPLPSFVHRRKSYRYDMIQSLPWLPTVSLVLCGRFYLRHFTEFHSVPCWSYFVCLCVCVQVLKKEKSLSKRTVWRIWSPKLSSLRDNKKQGYTTGYSQPCNSGWVNRFQDAGGELPQLPAMPLTEIGHCEVRRSPSWPKIAIVFSTSLFYPLR
jgi:hypothetical protein